MCKLPNDCICLFYFQVDCGGGGVVWGWLYLINSLQKKTQKIKSLYAILVMRKKIRIVSASNKAVKIKSLYLIICNKLLVLSYSVIWSILTNRFYIWIGNVLCLWKQTYDIISLLFSAWNGRSPSRQMRLISYSGDQKLLQIR